jgi:hypothetical protein
MLLKLYRAYKTGKTLYNKVLKPAYLELRKDAYELDKKDTRAQNRKRKTVKKNAVNQKSKRINQRKADS